MDNKNVIIAVVLSLVVLIGWNWLFPPVPPQAPPEVRAWKNPHSLPPPALIPDPREAPEVAFTPTEGGRVTVNTPEYLAVINTAGGILERFELKQYRESLAPGAAAINMIKPQALAKAPLGIIFGQTATWREAEWRSNSFDMTISPGREGSLVIEGRLGDLLLTRELTFTGGSYLIREDLRVRNRGKPGRPVPLLHPLRHDACPRGQPLRQNQFGLSDQRKPLENGAQDRCTEGRDRVSSAGPVGRHRKQLLSHGHSAPGVCHVQGQVRGRSLPGRPLREPLPQSWS
jgi:YidC/Oxa1 family membrane protein insertase